MGRRLVIQHGERVTRHELWDKSLLIGRDPGCDLFFADQKLSRRHARVDPGRREVVLVDLGSRNGSWVNEIKIGEQPLVSGDIIRIGGLQITFEEDPLPAPASLGSEDATVVLSGASKGGQDSGTVQDGDNTAFFSETPPSPSGFEREVIEPAEDTGTVAYHEEPAGAGVDTNSGAREISKTLVRPQESLSLQELHADDFLPDGGERSESVLRESLDEELGRMFSSKSLSVQLALVLSGLAFAAYLMGLVSMRYSAEGAGGLVIFGVVSIAVAVGGTVLLFKKIMLNHVRNLPRRGNG